MSEPVRYRFTKRQKLRRPVEFKRLYDRGAKAGDDHLLAFVLPNDLGTTRVGLSVSKKHGSAVRRNRVKRLLREAFRLGQHDLPCGLDLVLVPRPKSGATLADYRRSLAGCVRRAVKRLPPRDPADESPKPEIASTDRLRFRNASRAAKPQAVGEDDSSETPP